MRRRAFLAGGAGAGALAVLATQAGCASPAPAPSAPLPGDSQLDAVSKLRTQYLAEFDADYVENVILPFFRNTVAEGERPVMPMIDVALTKENALPYDLWGLLSKTWKPAPEEGVTVFLQGLEKRGPDNRRKRIYMSAVTPGPLPADVPGQGRCLLGPAVRTPERRQAADADLSGHVLGPLLGSAPGREGQGHPGPGAADRGKLQHRSGVPRSDAQDRVRQLPGRPTEPRLPEEVDRRQARRHRIRQDAGTAEDVRLLLAEEQRGQRVLPAAGRRLRVLPQLRGIQPMGQQPLQRDEEAGPRHRRSAGEELVHHDDVRQLRRQTGRRSRRSSVW